jgi:GlpG protein
MPKGDAEKFCRFLRHEGIDSESRDEDNDQVVIWIINEDHLTRAEQYLAAFKRAPDDSKFNVKATSSTPSPGALKSGPRAKGNDRGRMVDVRSEIFARSPSRQMPVTIALIALSILATLASGLPGLSGLTRLLYFSEYLGGNFPEIVHGQIWRLVTPIFLHGGIWHLLFNMMWIYQLGGAMEIHEGSRFLLLFTVLISILVNSAEYLATGPLFIGMSGVVYAMLGYAWIMSRHQYNSPYELGPGTTFIMMAWLVLCLVGVIPGVANTQHVIGLLLGGLLGLYRSRYISNWLRQSRRK